MLDCEGIVFDTQRIIFDTKVANNLINISYLALSTLIHSIIYTLFQGHNTSPVGQVLGQ